MVFDQATLRHLIPTVSSETASILHASGSLSCFGDSGVSTGLPLKQASYREIRISLPAFPTSETTGSTLRLSQVDFGGSLLDEGFFGYDFNLADYIFDVPEEDESLDGQSTCGDTDSINLSSDDFLDLIVDETISLSSSLDLSAGSESSLAALAGSADSLWKSLSSSSPSKYRTDANPDLDPNEKVTALDSVNPARSKWHSVMVRIDEFQEELSYYLSISPSHPKNEALAQDSPANFNDSFVRVAKELSLLWPMPPKTPVVFVGRPGVDW